MSNYNFRSQQRFDPQTQESYWTFAYLAALAVEKGQGDEATRDGGHTAGMRGACVVRREVAASKIRSLRADEARRRPIAGFPGVVPHTGPWYQVLHDELVAELERNGYLPERIKRLGATLGKKQRYIIVRFRDGASKQVLVAKASPRTDRRATVRLFNEAMTQSELSRLFSAAAIDLVVPALHGVLVGESLVVSVSEFVKGSTGDVGSGGLHPVVALRRHAQHIDSLQAVDVPSAVMIRHVDTRGYARMAEANVR